MTEQEKYVVKLFPEIKEIVNLEVRQKVINCWLIALQDSQWKSIEAMPWIPGLAEYITNVQHTVGAARIGMAIVKTINASQDVAPGASIDLDTVIAGCILHDVGKLLEYTGPENHDGEKTPLGKRMLHHILGAHLAIRVGLSAEIVHCVEAHREPESYERSLEAQIVGWADRLHAHAVRRAHTEISSQ
jgi:putative nucleotidyltransferase with HDIG domain